MHYLQKNILDQLRLNPSQRYSQLQPDDIESSHFKYHLQQLINEGLVEQKSRGIYGLTAKGKSQVDQLSDGRVNPHSMPKVITYTLLQDQDHYYLLRKDKEPYLGLINMIGGKLHSGESAEQAAHREMLEKTGGNVEKLELKGVAQIRIKQAEGLLSHAVAFVFVADINSAKLKQFISIKKSDIKNSADLAPDLLPILSAIEESNEPFVIDLAADYQPKSKN